MRTLHPLTEANLHIFTPEQQEKIKSMIPDRDVNKYGMSQPNGKRVGLLLENGVSVK